MSPWDSPVGEGVGDVAKHITIKWRLAVLVLPLVAAVVLGKILAHYFEVEYLSLNPLFGALVSANVFLIGFLIAGVLGDYKEGERLPGDLACSLEAIIDETEIVYLNNKSSASVELMQHMKELIDEIVFWFYKKEKTRQLLKSIAALNPHFLALERHTQGGFILRMKNEQNNIRKMIVRIHTIRETSFNPAGYAVAEIMSFTLSVALVFTKIEPYYESIFFVMFVCFVQIYMVMLIRDLDNPFDYYSGEDVIEHVSLKPIYDVQRRVVSPLALDAVVDPVAVPNVSPPDPPAIALAPEPAATPIAPVTNASPVPASGSGAMKRPAKNKRRR